MKDIEVSFPGGMRVDAQIGAFVVRTDQPVDHGGDGTAVTPFDLFLASLASCAGFYILAFCQARHLPMDGLRLRQRVLIDPGTTLPSRICLELELPASFPEKYRNAIVRAAYLAYLTTVGAALGWLLHRDPDTYRYIPASIRQYPGADAVADMFAARGFSRVRCYPILGGLMTLHHAIRD